MPDSWSEFWERLLVDVVAVLILSFLLQGLWFFGVDLLKRMNPGLEPGLVRTSARLGTPWILAILFGIGWSAWRAWGISAETRFRR